MVFGAEHLLGKCFVVPRGVQILWASGAIPSTRTRFPSLGSLNGTPVGGASPVLLARRHYRWRAHRRERAAQEYTLAGGRRSRYF